MKYFKLLTLSLIFSLFLLNGCSINYKYSCLKEKADDYCEKYYNSTSFIFVNEKLIQDDLYEPLLRMEFSCMKTDREYYQRLYFPDKEKKDCKVLQ